MASSTPVISSSVAPVASAWVALHSRQTSGDPIAASGPYPHQGRGLGIKGPVLGRAEAQPGLIAGAFFVDNRQPAQNLVISHCRAHPVRAFRRAPTASRRGALYCLYRGDAKAAPASP